MRHHEVRLLVERAFVGAVLGKGGEAIKKASEVRAGGMQRGHSLCAGGAATTAGEWAGLLSV